MLRSGTQQQLSCVFTADGRWLLTGGNDPFVRVWSVETGQRTSAWLTGPEATERLQLQGDTVYAGKTPAPSVLGALSRRHPMTLTASELSLRDFTEPMLTELCCYLKTLRAQRAAAERGDASGAPTPGLLARMFSSPPAPLLRRLPAASTPASNVKAALGSGASGIVVQALPSSVVSGDAPQAALVGAAALLRQLPCPVLSVPSVRPGEALSRKPQKPRPRAPRRCPFPYPFLQQRRAGSAPRKHGCVRPCPDGTDCAAPSIAPRRASCTRVYHAPLLYTVGCTPAGRPPSASSSSVRSVLILWHPNSEQASIARASPRSTPLLRSTTPSIESFRWPLALCHARQRPGLGVVLAPRSDEFVPALTVLSDDALPLLPRLTLAVALAHGVFKLHAQGFAHGTLQLAELWAQPKQAKILLGGLERAGLHRVAPDAPRPRSASPKPRRPSSLHATQTSTHNVLLYGLLVGRSPFRPSAQDQTTPGLLRHTHAEPLEDPHETRWNILPQSLRHQLFQSLGAGQKSPALRSPAGTWLQQLQALLHAHYPCAGCGLERLYDGAYLRTHEGQSPACPGCGRNTPLPPRLRIGNRVFLLPWGTKLYAHQVLAPNDSRAQESLAGPGQLWAETSAHPYRAKVVGLKNCSPERWWVTMPDGSSLYLPPGKTLRLETGQKLGIGPREAEVKL